jgi:hypothetical protein
VAKFNYAAMTDTDNVYPKRLPNIPDADAAASALSNLNVPVSATVDVDDAREFWNNASLLGVYGISVKTLFYSKSQSLNSFLP